MARRKGTRRYTVKAMVENLDLTKAGSSTYLEVYSANEGKIGTLEIGRGSLRWFVKNGRKGKRISWMRFAHVMEDL